MGSMWKILCGKKLLSLIRCLVGLGMSQKCVLQNVTQMNIIILVIPYHRKKRVLRKLDFYKIWHTFTVIPVYNEPPLGPKNSGLCWQVVVVHRSFILWHFKRRPQLKTMAFIDIWLLFGGGRYFRLGMIIVSHGVLILSYVIEVSD